MANKWVNLHGDWGKLLENPEIPQLREDARPAPHLSGRYIFQPTRPLLELIHDRYGDSWEPFRIGYDAKDPHGRHVIRLRSSEATIDDGSGQPIYPELYISNSYNGKTCVVVRGGLYRQVCSNGLVVQEHEYGMLKIKHLRHMSAELHDEFRRVVKIISKQMGIIKPMIVKELSKQERIELALKMADVRFGGSVPEIDPQVLITPMRPQDDRATVWHTLNVAQERLMKGEFHFRTKNGKIRKARKITSFISDEELNAKWFEIATEYV